MKQLALFVITLLLIGCSSKPRAVNSSDITVKKPIVVSIVSHGWHTGFVVPSQTITEQLPLLKKRFTDTPFIEFGWGDMDFYQAEEVTLALSIQAILWPSRAVIHAVAIPEPAEIYFQNSDVKSICLEQEQFSKLLSFIENSFSKALNGNIVPMQKGLYGNSQFYQAVGEYHLMNTCNTWTAKGLSSAGMGISTTFKSTAGSIMDYLSEYNTPLTNSANGCSLHRAR